ncbi:hypothetical protein [Mesorhizobium sp.]|uniref:hypothetical protein n=1 Tax=Mesorhizobium sp. TaxID=1871066 RepID=UPI000FE63868|nr:hypothetical protein [Mesorhizobium sp.]RWG25796.1 MAG: hypothetical protein EOQ60_28815 [Mesorhizobium sp.]
MYLTVETAKAEIARLDVQIAEQEAALKNLRTKRAMLIEQTKPPRPATTLTFDAAVRVTAERLGISYEEAKSQLTEDIREGKVKAVEPTN